MKHTAIVISLYLLISFATKADVIYLPFAYKGAAVSLEGAARLEKPFSKRNSAAIVGALGATSIVKKIQDPGVKGQVALEVRRYYKKDAYSGFNLGLNAGLAFMRYPGYHFDQKIMSNTIGFVPALRLSYTKRLNTSFLLEPYVEVTTPWNSGSMGDWFEDLSNTHNPDLILNLGFRVGFNKLLQKNQTR